MKTRGLIVLLAALAFGLMALWISRQPRPNDNALAIGQRATLASVEIDLQAPAELDAMTKAQVLQLRRDAVRRYPGLIAGTYEPADVVFAQIEDGLPWWGIQGQFYFGAGDKSIVGPAEESRFILNPYLLVAVGFDGLSIWADDALWNRGRISEQDLDRADFPFDCRPSSLRWQPRAASAQVAYDVTAYLARLNQWTRRRLGVADASFSLTAYNARDFNLNYFYLRDSRNLIQANAPDAPIVLPEFIHRGGSCGYPGGCNNASPYVAALSDLAITRLPAQATIWLWKEKPAAIQSPDMTFVMDFK